MTSLFGTTGPLASAILGRPEQVRATVARRVVIATVERPDGDTGIHVHTRVLMDGLKRAGVQVELANPFSASAIWLPFFAIRKFGLKQINPTWGLRWYRHWHFAAVRQSLMRLAAQQPVDVIVAQCPLSARAAMEVRQRLNQKFRIAMVCHFNYSEATEYREKGELTDPAAFDRMIQQEAATMQNVDQVIYVSNWARTVVESERAIHPTQSRVIWNGITATAKTSNVTRADLNLSAEDLVLINVGTLEPRKNQIGLLDLFARIHADYANAKLLLVGGGPQAEQIEKKIAELNLGDSVRMLGHRTDVPTLLGLSDIYVHYSKLENCPIVLLECARAGLPSAAIHAGGISELGEQLGSITPLNETDLDASLSALRPLLDYPPYRQERGIRARAAFEANFTQDAMIRDYLDALGLSTAEVKR
jgi:glycosyltransferase involved in cell wall biosynthesis